MQDVQLRPDATRAVLKTCHPWVYAAPSVAPSQGLWWHEIHTAHLGWGIADDGDIALRVLPEEPQPIGDFLRHRLQKADLFVFVSSHPYDLLPRLQWGGGRTAWGGGRPLWWGRCLGLYSAGWECHLSALVRDRTLGVVLGQPCVSALWSQGVDGKSWRGNAVGWSSLTPRSLWLLKSMDVRFLVRPAKGQRQACFLDQREHRRTIVGLSAGRRVFNLFGYNGGFSLYAAMGGASRVETVDVSAAATGGCSRKFSPQWTGSATNMLFTAPTFFKWEAPGKAGLSDLRPAESHP